MAGIATSLHTPHQTLRFASRRLASRVLSLSVMEDIDLKGRLDRIEARFAEMQQLIVGEGERARKHLDIVKLVLTEVRGLGTKVDRLTRARGRNANQSLIP